MSGRLAEMMAEQLHQRKKRQKRKKFRPGQLKKRGMGYVSPSVKKSIDYELPHPLSTLRDKVIPPDGTPIPWTASRKESKVTSRRMRLAGFIIAQRPIRMEELDLPAMLQSSFSPFPSFRITVKNGKLRYVVGTGERTVVGDLDREFGRQAYMMNGEKLAETKIRAGISVTDRLADMADDFLSFGGDKPSFEQLIKDLDRKREE